MDVNKDAQIPPLLESVLNDAEEYLGPNFLISSQSRKFDWDAHNEATITNIVSALSDTEHPKIAYLSSYSSTYTRTEALQALFTKTGLNADYFVYPGEYGKLLLETWKIRNKYDIYFVAFRGQEILPFIRQILGVRKKLVFDAFVSVYDTLCYDRPHFKPAGLIGKLLKKYDRFLCSISDVVLVDTCAHKTYFEQTFDCQKVAHIYVSCNKSLFKRHSSHSGNYIFWYGSANPLQGVENILRWAKSLENKVQFVLAGPIRKKYGPLITELSPGNIEFIDYLPYEELPAYMSGAMLCLGGHFSTKDKAMRVIAGKTFQMIECCDHVLLAENPANREIFPKAN